MRLLRARFTRDNKYYNSHTTAAASATSELQIRHIQHLQKLNILFCNAHKLKIPAPAVAVQGDTIGSLGVVVAERAAKRYRRTGQLTANAGLGPVALFTGSGFDLDDGDRLADVLTGSPLNAHVQRET